MNVLAFDTCFGTVSAVVRWDGAGGNGLLQEAQETLAVGHAERLLPLIDKVMAAAGLRYADLHRIAVTVGPGSFTGLRVGVATARALSLATGLPVVAMTSLAVMAAEADMLLGAVRHGRPIAVVVDARREANYVQIFGAHSNQPLSEPKLMTCAQAAAALPAEAMLVVGSGAAAVVACVRRGDVEAALPDLQPHARHLALLAPVLKPLDRVNPLYLRAADAKPSTAPSLARRTGP